MGVGIATRLAEKGAVVTIVGRHADSLEEARAAISAVGPGCDVIQADLSSRDGAVAAADAALSLASHWDVFIHTAGDPPGPLLLETELDYWDQTYGVHTRALFVLGKALAPGMIELGHGHILSMSSTASVSACRGHGTYSSAKAALNMLTQTMALEWGPHGILANVVMPTATMTKMGRVVWGDHPVQAEWLESKIPSGRFAEVSDIVDLVEFLVGPRNSYINGALIPIDGGLLTGLTDGPPDV